MKIKQKHNYTEITWIILEMILRYKSSHLVGGHPTTVGILNFLGNEFLEEITWMNDSV